MYIIANPLVYNYLPTTNALNNAADSIPSLVSIDIDSVVRSVTPDIGAYEFTVGTLDAKIDWVNPMGAQTAGNKTVRVKITNTSIDPITSLILNYTDGTTVYTDTFPSVALLTGDTLIANFTNQYNVTAPVSFRGFITSVNGGLDFVRGNDTTTWQDVCIAMAAGTYTINSALPDTGSNFSSFNNAVTAMSCGITGPVIFNVAPGSGPYTEQVDIPFIPGSSAINTITINGNNNELIFAGGNATNWATLNLNGTDHLTVKNLVITGTALTNCFGVHLMGNATYNTFDSCTISVPITPIVTTVIGVSISGSKILYSTTGINASNNLFNRCTVNGGYYAMSFYGYTTIDTNNRNNSITNCIVRDAYAYGIYNIYQGYSTISNNIIERPNRTNSTTTGGVILSTNCANILVEKNRVRNLFGAFPGSTSAAYGLYCSSSAASSGFENKFINNVVSDIKSNGTIYAIYTLSSVYVQIYHNTINLDDQTATAGTTYGVYSTFASPTGVEVVNNIIHITRTGTGTKYCLYFGGPLVSNYNDLYINSPAGVNGIGYFTSSFTTLADWQTANGGIWDQNSVDFQPNFLNVNTNNFKPTNTLLDNLGTNVGVTTDIVNKPRSVSTPDIGAYEITLSPIDLGAITISPSNPNFNGCYDTAQTITVQVQNYGTDTLRFGLTPATVTCYISGAISDTVVASITDTLLPGATKWVTINAGVNMSAIGTYNILARTNIAGDGDTLNDFMAAAESRTAVGLSGGTISSSTTAPTCLSGSPTSILTGAIGANIQWQTATDTNGVWTNVGTLNSANYTPIAPFTQSTYVRAYEYCNVAKDSTNILYFKILNPSVSSITLDTVCGAGIASLGVQIANATGVKWYAAPTGNSLLDTNLSYNTPTISSSKTYYVSANTGGVTVNSLPLNPASVGTGATSTAPQYLTFSLSSEAQIISVDVFPTNIGTGSILIKNSTNTVTLHTIPFNNTSITNGTTPFKVFFNIVLPAGNYIMSQGSTSVSMIRNSAGATYPYVAGPLSITGNSFNTAYYYWFFNWSVSTGCESARVPVTATVLTAPKITAPRELGFCMPGSVNTQVDSASIYNNYTWSPMTGISPSGNNVSFNPATTTVYTVTATQSSGFNCINTAQIAVKAHANPVPNITGADTIFCQSNSPAELSVISATNRTANNWTTLLYQSFESGLNGWSIGNEMGREPSSAWMVVKTPAAVGTQTFNFDSDSCIVAFNDSSTSYTATYLNAPSISTVGYDSLRMSSRMIYDYAAGDSLDVQASTNGGIDWVNVAGTWVNFDVSLGAPAGAILGFNIPATFLNQADLQLRMRSKSNNGFVVGIDNIAVEGKKHASFNWTSSIGGYTSNREDSVQVRPAADAYYYVQMIDSNTGCQGRDTALVRKGLVDLTKIMNGGTSGSTDSLEATCNDESTGWTYYSGTGSLSNSNFYFAINWDTNYTARSLAKAKIGTSANYILDTSDPSGTLMRGTWVMKKYWNVNLNGATLGTPVKVRFYFDPSDSATISNAAETYVNQYLTVPMRPWMEPFTWFKTQTGEYVPGANIDSSGVEMFNNVSLNVESYGNENGAHYVQFSNVTSFSGGSGSSGAGIGTPLPVELLYFKAKALESGNFLYWATASEKNNSHFEIESSNDGEHFKYIGRIEGAGNSAELKTYDFTDLQPSSNKTYYRLKQVDFDGMFEYSKIQVVTRDGKISFDALVYPIPARDNITIDVQSNVSTSVNITITDITGKLVKAEELNVLLGSTKMKIDISEFSTGNYIVVVDNGIEKINRKFVKVK